MNNTHHVTYNTSASIERPLDMLLLLLLLIKLEGSHGHASHAIQIVLLAHRQHTRAAT
jgi:hypothetical protein